MYYNLFVYLEQQKLRDRLSKSKESLKEYQKVQKGIMAVNAKSCKNETNFTNKINFTLI